MSLYPQADHFLLPESSTQPIIKPTIVILHTHVGPKSPQQFRNVGTASAQEYHFDVRRQADQFGKSGVRQYMDTQRRADNNYKANSFTKNGVLCGAISIETADMYYEVDAAGNRIDPQLKWNWSQLGMFESVAQLVAWCCRTHNIPMNWCPGPFEPGIGWHSMWGINPEDGDGPNPWTNKGGKTCPGPTFRPVPFGVGKIGQLNPLLTRIRQINTEGDDELTDEEHDALMGTSLRVVQLQNELFNPGGMKDDLTNTMAQATAAKSEAAAAKVQAQAAKDQAAACNTELDTVRTNQAASDAKLNAIAAKLAELELSGSASLTGNITITPTP